MSGYCPNCKKDVLLSSKMEKLIADGKYDASKVLCAECRNADLKIAAVVEGGK